MTFFGKEKECTGVWIIEPIHNGPSHIRQALDYCDCVIHHENSQCPGKEKG